MPKKIKRRSGGRKLRIISIWDDLPRNISIPDTALQRALYKLNVCFVAMDWVGERAFGEAWDDCPEHYKFCLARALGLPPMRYTSNDLLKRAVHKALYEFAAKEGLL